MIEIQQWQLEIRVNGVFTGIFYYRVSGKIQPSKFLEQY